jgi:DNA-binding HxlR family transcriptional regulator
MLQKLLGLPCTSWLTRKLLNEKLGISLRNMSKIIKFIAHNITKFSISRTLKRLRIHGIIKKTAKGYKYYLTKFGKEIINCSQKLINNGDDTTTNTDSLK